MVDWRDSLGTYRLSHSFTSGELSPLMHARVDFDRYRNGCITMKNAVCATQGPAVRRPGFNYVYDMADLDIDPDNPEVRLIPFVFSELQAYVMIFFKKTTGVFLAFGYRDGILVYDTHPAWVTATVYYAGDVVTQGGSQYTCLIGHTSGVFATDLGAGKWVIRTCVIGTPGDPVVVSLGTLWDIEAFDWAQSADEMYISQQYVAPSVIKRYGHDCWVLETLSFTGTPAEWVAGAYPERVSFHQQRLVYAANATRRQTVWMTDAGDFTTFTVGTTGSDQIIFTLDSGTQNKIQWLTSGRALNIGTLGDEWSVVGGTQTALTPSNILSQKQTNKGSEPNKPLIVGQTTLFIERHGRTVDELIYDYNSDGYKTSDMTILSEHITEHYSIVDWAFQQTPDSIIWCIREDGYLLGITYQRDHKVIGWHRHNTQGEFKAVATIPGQTREDDVWVMVQRVLPGGTKYYIEIMDDWFKGTEASEGRFLDSYLDYAGVPTSGLTGLDHLEGMVVDVLAEGTVHPPRTVVSGGITLDDEYSQVVVGLSYETEIQPNLTDVTSQEGTSLGRTQRITNVLINYYNSLGCIVGRTDDNGDTIEERIPFRVPADNMGEQVPLYSGWYEWEFPEGYNRGAGYFIKQDQPLPLTIRAVVDEVEIND